MPQSKHLQTRDAVAAAIAAARPALDGGVHTNRNFLLATGVMAQVHVNLAGSDPQGDDPVITGAPRDWSTDLEVVILTRKDNGVEAADAADAIWVDAYAAVMADQSLGGLAWELVPGRVDVESEEADTSVCRLTWNLAVHHRTTNNVLTS